MMRIFVLAATVLALTACELNDTMTAVRKTPAQMEEMQAELTKTSEAIRLQKLSIALENIEKTENARVLSPVPFGLMPWSKVYAETGTVEEIVKISYLWLKEINEEVLRVPLDGQGNEIAFTPQQIDDINHHKQHRLLALQTIAGQIPVATIDAMITEHINGNSRFRDVVFAILMMRVQALRDVFLDASLLSEPIDNVGKLEEALGYMMELDRMLTLPFADRIKLSITGFLPPLEKFEESLTVESGREMATQIWKRLQAKATSQVQLDARVVTGDASADQALQARDQARYESALATIQGYVNR